MEKGYIGALVKPGTKKRNVSHCLLYYICPMIKDEERRAFSFFLQRKMANIFKRVNFRSLSLPTLLDPSSRKLYCCKNLGISIK